MAKNYKGTGEVVQITSVASGVTAGTIYRRGSHPYWMGVVINDIIGTGDTLTTIDGRPIIIGDGVAAEAQVGDGKGELMVVGVHALRCMAGVTFSDGDPVYGAFDNTTPGATASGVVSTASASGLIGFAEGANYTDTTAPYSGLVMVDVKLPGFPIHGIGTHAS